MPHAALNPLAPACWCDSQRMAAINGRSRKGPVVHLSIERLNCVVERWVRSVDIFTALATLSRVLGHGTWIDQRLKGVCDLLPITLSTIMAAWGPMSVGLISRLYGPFVGLVCPSVFMF